MAMKIIWGSSNQYTLNFEYLDNAVNYTEPRQGSTFGMTASGEEDAWWAGEDFLLAGDVRWIPMQTVSGRTGYKTAGGWRDFLSYARQKVTFRYYPDASAGTYYSCYLKEPMNGAPTLEASGLFYSLHLVIRNSADAPID